mgnify:CR=1 FL=1
MSRSRGRSPYEENKEDNPQIYVGRLPRGLHERDLEDIFLKFGKTKSVLLKRGFAFIVSIFTLPFKLLGILRSTLC